MVTHLPYANNIIRCVYSGTYSGSKWANVFHVRGAAGPISAADAASLATNLRTAWDTNLKALLPSNGALTGVSVVDLSSAYGNAGADTTTVAGTKTTAGAMSASIATCVSFKIARRYRGGHPRMYLTGNLTTETNNAITWTNAWITAVSTAMANWRTAINALTLTSTGALYLCSLSYYADSVLRTTPLANDITDIAVHTRIDTQRRRLGREITA